VTSSRCHTFGPVHADAAFARRSRTGSCASKHALLAEELAAVGIEITPLLAVGHLVPNALRDEGEFAHGLD
jgi:hypothetical protein